MTHVMPGWARIAGAVASGSAIVVVLVGAVFSSDVEVWEALVVALALAALGALCLARPRAGWAPLDRATAAVGWAEESAARIYKEHAGAAAPALAALEERDRLLDALAHELKTPLNSIRGFADVLLDEIDGPLAPDVREEVLAIREAGEQLQEQIDEVLDVAAGGRISDAGLAPIADVAAIAGEVVRTHSPRAKEKGIALSASVPDESVLTALDVRRVRQVLSNLVGNAVKFTAKGEVVVTVVPRGGEIRVEVRDTGPGIAPADHARIFTAWERVGRGREDGHGLGLAIASDLASQLGGRIEVESELGKGARFTLVLPHRVPA